MAVTEFEMNEKELEERKKYLALQAFYLKMKGLLEELEKKLNPELMKSSEKGNYQ